MMIKKGISLVSLVVAIIILIVISSVVILQIDNGIFITRKNEFVTELAVIQDKIKEHYLLVGQLPVKSGEEYTVNELLTKLTDEHKKQILQTEITLNKDDANKFFVVDLDKIKVETNERGKEGRETDIFVVANNTLNVYYLQGVELEGEVRFSQATLVENNNIETNKQDMESNVDLKSQLVVIKNTNVWTKEIVITIKGTLKSDEKLQYNIGGAINKDVTTDKIIISSNTMTDLEKNAFNTNKQIIINKLLNGNVIETKNIDISNLDISRPGLESMSMTDTSNADYNIVTISSSDQGLSGVRHLYYVYNSEVLDNIVEPYYTNSSKVTVEFLMNFGNITNNGIIKLDKNIKSIYVMSVDNAGNASEIVLYTIQDEYIISK